jgi:hypothetical protein
MDKMQTSDPREVVFVAKRDPAPEEVELFRAAARHPEPARSVLLYGSALPVDVRSIRVPVGGPGLMSSYGARLRQPVEVRDETGAVDPLLSRLATKDRANADVLLSSAVLVIRGLLRGVADTRDAIDLLAAIEGMG